MSNDYIPLKDDEQNLLQEKKFLTEERKSKIIYITSFTLIAFILEYFLRTPLTNLSESIQSQLVSLSVLNPQAFYSSIFP